MSRLLGIIIAVTAVAVCTIALDKSNFRVGLKEHHVPNMMKKKNMMPVVPKVQLKKEEETGTCGELSWSYDDVTRTLTFNGTGPMTQSCYYNFQYNVEHVVISDGITSIAESAFYNWNIKTVSIGNSVEVIGDEAFRFCYSLESVIIPDSVKSIGDEAFQSCDDLSSVSIGKSVESIGKTAFGGCSLTDFQLSGENQYFSLEDGVLFNKNKTTLMLCSAGKEGSYTIPDSVTAIEGYAFYDCGLKSVVIGNNVVSINAYAFYYCSQMETVTIGNKVKTIGEEAFSHCYALKSVTIPDSVESIGDDAFNECYRLQSIEVGSNNNYYTSIDGVLLNKQKTIVICHPMKRSGTFTIPDSVKTINDYAFCDCDGLTSVTFGNSVETIGNDAFYSCSSLRSITLPNSLITIGNQAFYNCRSLKSVTFGNALKEIGDEAFEYCRSITSISLPDSVESLGDNIFGSCKMLESITIGDSNKYYTSIDGVLYDKEVTSILQFPTARPGEYIMPDTVKSIDNYAFRGCPNLTSVKISKSVTAIRYYAFEDCPKLTTVIISDNVTTIEYGAFRECISLTSVTFGKNVHSIYSEAFYGCISLTSITIPDSVSSISGGAFAECSKLVSIEVSSDNNNYRSDNGVLYNKQQTSLIQYPCGKNGQFTIPDSVTSIGSNAFSGSANLISVTISNSVTSIGSNAFSGCIGLTSINIPNSVESLGSSAFEECINLRSVTLSENITSIQYSTFYDCSNLTSIRIPNSVSSISSDAFYGCSSLTNIEVGENNEYFISEDNVVYDKEKTAIVIFPGGKGGAYTIPDSVTSLSYNTFRGCTKLTSVTVGKGITSVGDGMFYGCTGLTSVIIPASVTSIDRWAFEDCYNLSFIQVDTNNEYYATDNGVLYDKEMTSIILYPYGKSGPYTIPDSVTTIKHDTFYERNRLTSLTFGKNVKSIGEAAIAFCEQLTEVIISESLETYEPLAIVVCNNLKKIEVNGNNPYFVSENGVLFNKQKTTLLAYPAGKEGEYAIPESVTIIGEGAFSGAHFTSMNIGNSVARIEAYAFYMCSNLKSITIDKSVTFIGGGVFCECESLKTVTYKGTRDPGMGYSMEEYCDEISLEKICVPAEYTSSTFCGMEHLAALSECGDIQPSSSDVLMPHMMLVAVIAIALVCLF